MTRKQRIAGILSKTSVCRSLAHKYVINGRYGMVEHLKKNIVEVAHDLVSLRYVSLRKRFFLVGGSVEAREVS